MLKDSKGRVDFNSQIWRYSGKTPLMIAARGNYVTIVDMIIKAERFASLYAQSSRDDDIDVREVLKRVSFKPDSTPETQFIRSLLYKLSTKVRLGSNFLSSSAI